MKGSQGVSSQGVKGLTGFQFMGVSSQRVKGLTDFTKELKWNF